MLGPAPIWPCPPRTKAKLRILDTYLGAWFGIIARQKNFPRVLYFDGFSGPGKYATGEEGSPLIALKHANNVCQLHPNFKPILIFNDFDEKHSNYCRDLINIMPRHPNISWHVINENFESITNEMHKHLEGRWNYPILSFIDPFGIKGCGLNLIEKLLSYPRSECFINSMVGWANRFIEHQDAGPHVADLLGGEHVRDVLTSKDRIGRITEIYENKLRNIVPYVRKFLMYDEGNVRDNILIFAGRHPKGFIKMKEAMWALDPIGGNRFSAHQAKREQSMGNLLAAVLTPQTSDLKRLLIEKLSSSPQMSVGELIDFVERETDYLSKHCKLVLSELEATKELAVLGSRRRGTWPHEMIVSRVNG